MGWFCPNLWRRFFDIFAFEIFVWIPKCDRTQLIKDHIIRLFVCLFYSRLHFIAIVELFFNYFCRNNSWLVIICYVIRKFFVVCVISIDNVNWFMCLKYLKKYYWMPIKPLILFNVCIYSAMMVHTTDHFKINIIHCIGHSRQFRKSQHSWEI